MQAASVGWVAHVMLCRSASAIYQHPRFPCDKSHTSCGLVQRATVSSDLNPWLPLPSFFLGPLLLHELPETQWTLNIQLHASPQVTLNGLCWLLGS